MTLILVQPSTEGLVIVADNKTTHAITGNQVTESHKIRQLKKGIEK